MTKLISIFGGFALVATFACSQAETPAPAQPFVPTPPAPPKVYTFTEKPIWVDEFDIPGLPNDKIWSYDVGGSCLLYTSDAADE